MLYLCKFGHNPFIPLGDMVQVSHFSTFLELLWPWKQGEGHQNLFNSFLPPNNTHAYFWSWSIPKGDMSIFQHSQTFCDLENKIKITKIWSVLFHVPMIFCAYSRKIYPSIQEIKCRLGTFQHSLLSVTLKMESRSPKSYQLFCIS